MFVCVFLPKHYKIGFQPILATVFWAFLGAKSRVNNWATVGSITGPHAGPFFEAHVAQLLTLEFCLKMFFEIVFFKNLILLAERRK